MSAANAPIRLLLVEDVPQVAQYVRGLLNAQTQVKLVDVVNDGGRAATQARQLRPDVIIVDWLLQGRTKGDKVVAQLRESGLGIPVVVLTVPQSPVARDPAAGIDGVLGMPFSGFELVNVVVSPAPGVPRCERQRPLDDGRGLCAEGRGGEDHGRLQPRGGPRPGRDPGRPR